LFVWAGFLFRLFELLFVLDHIFLISFDAEASPCWSCCLQIKSWKVHCTVVQYIPLPEGEDDDDAVGGDAHVAADEAAGEPEVVRVVDVVGDGSDDLHAVVDEADHC